MAGFVALRCFNCSMMQVKQARKAGQKWTCSICNEKQSQLKVYACSTTAKEVRNFVQEFNLSTNTAADEAALQAAQKPPPVDPLPWATRPNKWHKYLSQDDEAQSEVPSDKPENCRFVTEMPEPKRARRKGGRSDLGSGDSTILDRSFQMKAKKGAETSSPARAPLTQVQSNITRGRSNPCVVAQHSKWSAYLTQSDENSWEP